MLHITQCILDDLSLKVYSDTSQKFYRIFTAMMIIVAYGHLFRRKYGLGKHHKKQVLGAEVGLEHVLSLKYTEIYP